jgi:hypothetical protein
MFILLVGVIYEAHYLDGPRWHDMYTMLHEEWLGHSGNIKVITSTI